MATPRRSLRQLSAQWVEPLLPLGVPERGVRPPPAPRGAGLGLGLGLRLGLGLALRLGPGLGLRLG